MNLLPMTPPATVHMLKMFGDKSSQLDLDTPACSILVKVHMEWSCKFSCFVPEIVGKLTNGKAFDVCLRYASSHDDFTNFF